MSWNWNSAAGARRTTRGAMLKVNARAMIIVVALNASSVGGLAPAQELSTQVDSAPVADSRWGDSSITPSAWPIRRRGELRRLPPLYEEIAPETRRLPPGLPANATAPSFAGNSNVAANAAAANSATANARATTNSRLPAPGTAGARGNGQSPSSYLTRDPAFERLSPHFTSQVVVTGQEPPVPGSPNAAPREPISPPNPAPDQAAESPSDANPPPASDGTRTYGQEPAQTRSEQTFLRTQSPLLEPGSWQFDVGATYLLSEFDYPAYSGTEIVRGELRRRQLVAPLALRYGLSERAQFFCNAPVGWRHNQIATNPMTDLEPFDLNDVHVGIGDVQLGTSYLARKSDGKDQSPDIVLTFVATLPTGEGLMPISILQGGLGTGIASLGGQALFIHTYDPVVVFWGFGYRHSFERTFSGVEVQVGEEFTGQLGVGFAVNERVTLSSSYLGGFLTETEFDGQGIPNSLQESHRTRFAVTISQERRILEPFVEIGLTQQTPTTNIGVVWTYSRGKKSKDKSSDDDRSKGK